MISIDDAWRLLQQYARPLPARPSELSAACGLQLVEPIVAEADSPPFDKSLVDGYAINAGDSSRQRTLAGRIVAGQTPTAQVAAGQAVRLMTGAPLPIGATAVVKFEDCAATDQEIRLPDQPIEPGAGVLRRGASYRAGQKLVAAGKRLTPLDLALIAETGQTRVLVRPRPQVAVLPTGNELAAAASSKKTSQIFNTNGPMLRALVAQAGAVPMDLGVARDDPGDLEQRIRQGLEADVLLLTGGVSAGDLDLVPAALSAAGVEQVFHHVAIKPGKPVWFGRWVAPASSETERRNVLVFGLPGHPVSALTAYQLLVAPTLGFLRGGVFALPSTIRGRLAAGVAQRGKRTAYLPCRLLPASGGGDATPTVELVPTQGSADLLAAARADGWVVLPPGNYRLAADAKVDVLVESPAPALAAETSTTSVDQ